MEDTILLLAPEFIIGIDIRTKKHAIVVILIEDDVPTRTAFMQMAGRAFRSKYFPTCHVFTASGKSTESAIEEKIQRAESEPFGGSARNLKLIKQHAEPIGKA